MAAVKDPEQLFTYKLGTALSMEKTIVSMLRQLERKANDSELKELLSHHRDETEQQIKNLEQAFSTLGAKATGHKSPPTDGIKTEGQQLLDKVEDELADSVILGGAAATEHHEISVYQSLITQAEAMGQQEVVSLLQANLQQEQQTLKKVERMAQQVARAKARVAR